MSQKLSRRKRLVYVSVPFVFFVLLNQLFGIIFGYPTTWQWSNSLMRQYPAGAFAPDGSDARLRTVHDPRRGYRLESEPIIPHDGQLLLHFGDSSTWGWGLRDRSQAYPAALAALVPSGVHSVNLGVPGYSSLQVLRYMESVVPVLQGRIIGITVYVGNNDATVEDATDDARLRWQPVAQLTGRLFPLCWTLLQPIVTLTRSDYREPRVSPVSYRENLEKMAALVRSCRIPIVVIIPPVPLAWKPGNITFSTSLAPRVRNSWVSSELNLALHYHDHGTNEIANHAPGCDDWLPMALEHDWVVPRIKRAWRDQLLNSAQLKEVKLLITPEVSLEAEYGYFWFTDYCHPDSLLHNYIANRIARILEK